MCKLEFHFLKFQICLDNFYSEDDEITTALFTHCITTNTPTHYLRFISTSTKVLSYFKCDEFADTGKRYLEKDYGLDCDGDRYKLFTVYGIIMIGVYPIGKFLGSYTLAADLPH